MFSRPAEGRDGALGNRTNTVITTIVVDPCGSYGLGQIVSPLAFARTPVPEIRAGLPGEEHRVEAIRLLLTLFPVYLR